MITVYHELFTLVGLILYTCHTVQWVILTVVCLACHVGPCQPQVHGLLGQQFFESESDAAGFAG